MPNLGIKSDDYLEPMIRLRNLSDVGAAVDVDCNIPLRRYFRSGLEMIRMANVYMDEGNFENAFILYSKFITLFVEKLPRLHQDYKQALPTDKANIKRKLNEVFPKAEKLKLYLRDRYSKDYDKYQSQKLVLEREAKEREEEDKRRQNEERRKREQENQFRLQEEFQKWKIVSPDDAVISNTLVGPTLPSDDLFDWSKWSGDASEKNQASVKEDLTGDVVLPVIPSRDLKPVNHLPSNRINNDIANVPSIDRSTKPSSLLSHGSTIQAWSSLRNITVPSMLMPKFLSLAEHNTCCNIETCGILTGKLAQNKFTVTHLLVPKQVGTADSCTTESEEEIFEFQDQHDLITLGWIHTHPSQTSFMSSVDLHTHCAYQLMLPEAIAIVCSPKYNETGIYWLTNDYGLDYIAKCQQTGFHPHPKEPPLYVESEHVHIDSTATINIVDLR